ncbi:hypothetical protein WDW89_00905 [Deltaproteobacteria bacterium TL4]
MKTTAKQQQLDLRYGGCIPAQHSPLWNEIAVTIRLEFTGWIQSISEPHAANIDWWVEGPASRNTSSCPLFHYCCAFILLEHLLENNQPPAEIIVDSKAFASLLKELLQKSGKSIPVTRPRSWKSHIKELFRPIYGSFFALNEYVQQFRQARKSGSLKRPLSNHKLILIDTFVLPGFIEKNRYYTGLWEQLSPIEQEQVYFVPQLSGFSIKQYRSAYQQMRQSSMNFLLREDYLKMEDYGYALGHLWRIRQLKITGSNFRGLDFSALVKEDLYHTRDLASAISALLNYRFTYRLQQQGVRLHRVINWFENQAIDKGWNAGFQKYYPDVPRIGYQGFIVAPHYLCMFPTRFEHDCKILPSILAVPGVGHIEEKKEFFPEVKIMRAPAFRFQGTWNPRKHYPGTHFTMLSTLTMEDQDNQAVLRFIASALPLLDLSKLQIWIKPHPTQTSAYIRNLYGADWPEAFELVEGDFNDCVEKANLLLGYISSTCVETLAKGIPVLILGNPNGLTHNPIPQSIPHEIWRLCDTPRSLAREIEFYRSRSQEDYKHYERLGQKIREAYFEPLTPEGIRTFLGFDNPPISADITDY